MTANPANNNLFIGLMSGTSVDGIDAALVSFENNQTQLLDTITVNISAEIKSALHKLCGDENISLQLLGETDTQLGHLFADAVLQLLKKAGKNASDIKAVGSHGQTIYHHPHGKYPFTLQIGDPNIITARTNITTVADFRRKDIALGGQGAPLVPVFHDYLLQDRINDCCVINIGGIANITYLPADKSKSITGFDTGPGNTLLDRWHEKHRENSVDWNGEWARSGKLNTVLLDMLLSDAYFKKPFPKSTGREYFNLYWLQEKLSALTQTISTEDVQNTLTELTAITIAQAIPHTHAIYVCGGGTRNLFLMERLRAHCASIIIQTTEAIGIDPQWMEAAAFAWLAKQTLESKSSNLPSVTGARRKTILGGIYGLFF